MAMTADVFGSRAPISVRRARADEASALSAIAHAAKARWGYPPAWLTTWDQELTFSPDTFVRMTVLVAEEARGAGADRVGVAAVERRLTDWSLEHFWVIPAAERRGIGRALFAEVVRLVEQEDAGPIDIVSDPHAAAFYQRMGAQLVGSVPAPMPSAPDRILPRLVYRVVRLAQGSDAVR
jgi:GNAT superfamily N-acetyltransferase